MNPLDALIVLHAEVDRETDGTAALAPGVLPLTLFPIEGIYTRTLPAGRSRDGKYDVKFLETSSPGLIGQSGGPIFDRDGIVWAVQSRTDIHPMCASVLEGRSGRKVKESHFLEVGVGIHPEPVAVRDPRGADPEDVSEHKPLLLLAVMLEAGPYSEQGEARLRTRQAVLEGLSESGFVPKDAEHIGFVTASWPPPETMSGSSPTIERGLLLPWEECDASEGTQGSGPQDGT